jgi:phage tail-like protein
MKIVKAIADRFVREVHATSGQTFADSSRHDPYKEFAFLVEITGNNVFAKAGFSKASGLKMSMDVIEYREGGDNNTFTRTPGLAKFEPITLERGMSEDGDMWAWAKKVFDSDPTYRANMIVKLLDDRDRKTVVKQWEFKNVWVSDYETGDFDASSQNVMIERLTVQQEGFDKTIG